MTAQTYLALVKNYNNLEWFDEADKCYYQYYRCCSEYEIGAGDENPARMISP